MTTQIIPVERLDTEATKLNKPGKLGLADRTYLLPPRIPIPGQKDACYKSALVLVEWIDANLERVHFRNRAGELLKTLDQVVAAILSDSLVEPEEAA